MACFRVPAALVVLPWLALLPACGIGLLDIGGTTTQTTLSFSQTGPLSFGISTSGLAVHRLVTLYNSGAAAASGLSSASATGSAFALRGGTWPGTGGTCTATLAPGQNCTFALTFGPQASGSHSGAFQLPLLSRAGLGFSLSGDATGGGFDTSFGSGGYAIVDPIYTTGNLRAVTRQADGRIVGGGNVSVGSQSHWLLTRWTSDGLVDTTFGGGTGFVVTPLASSTNAQYVSSLAMQSDGKIVAGGLGNPTSYYHFAVARYLTDGTLDSTFDGDGIRMDTISASSHAAGADLAIQSDGKIVMVGGDGNTGSWKFGIIRYTTGGALDNTFSGDGLVSQAFGTFVDYPQGIAIQSDGRLVLVGNRDIAFPQTGMGVVARFLTNGAVDSSFDTDGIAVLPLSTTGDGVRGITLQSDGKILVSGEVESASFDSDFVLYRFLTDGSLDATFGTGGTGQLVLDDSQYGVCLAVATDGKIYIAGDFSGEIKVARTLTDGTVDSSFGADGQTVLTVGTGNSSLLKMRLLPDGKILGAGYTQASGQSYPAIFRFFP